MARKFTKITRSATIIPNSKDLEKANKVKEDYFS
jgi:hypothetical protein